MTSLSHLGRVEKRRLLNVGGQAISWDYLRKQMKRDKSTTLKSNSCVVHQRYCSATNQHAPLCTLSVYVYVRAVYISLQSCFVLLDFRPLDCFWYVHGSVCVPLIELLLPQHISNISYHLSHTASEGSYNRPSARQIKGKQMTQ